MDRVDQLIMILLDESARIDERDDAAMDLGKFDDDRALRALLSVVLDPKTDPFILDVCGESIAEIWVRRNRFDFNSYKNMPPTARHEAHAYIKKSKPEWAKQYQLK